MQRTLRILPFLLLASSASAGDDRSFDVRWAIRAHMAKNAIVGASVAIAEEGQIVFDEGFGYSDVENRVYARPETVYRLASVSKAITAVAVLQLAERSLIDLDADVRDYVPEYPEKAGVVTVRHLLGHTSGVRHYRPGEIESMRPYASVSEGLGIFKDDPLEHLPGERFTYSTYGYSLLARVVETASGGDFPSYLAARVFGPAQMGAASVEDLEAIVPNRARGYARGRDGGPRNSAYADISYKWGGGGMVSTAGDLCRFGTALLGGRLLAGEFLSQMWTRQRLRGGGLSAYGLGWQLTPLSGREAVWHTGAQQQVRTMLIVFPKEETVVAILTNYEGHDVRRLGAVVSDTWFRAAGAPAVR